MPYQACRLLLWNPFIDGGCRLLARFSACGHLTLPELRLTALCVVGPCVR